jgi:solute carrier family 25 carnitine/acylcarnitine transporter 20/29
VTNNAPSEGLHSSDCNLAPSSSPQVGHPFDLVKVRLQSEGRGGRFSGPLHCVVHTVQEEGLRALYKGVTPPLLGTGVINALVFGMQGVFTPLMKRLDGVAESAPATVKQTAKAAVLSGIFISFVVTPIEGIKSRLQVQYHALGKTAVAATAGSAAAHPAPLYTGPVSCIKYVLKTQGRSARGIPCLLS